MKPGSLLLMSLLLSAPLAGHTADIQPTGDVPEASGWRSEVIVKGLEHPWSVAWLPDGSALVTERPGRLRIIRDGVLNPTAIGGVPDVLAYGQGGLLEVSLHPDFERNRLIYLAYATGTKTANRITLARARFTGTHLADLRVIFQNPDTKSDGQHFGSRLLWLPDKTLLMSIGDGGNPPIAFAGEPIRNQAQQLATVFGKIIRLHDDGSVPDDNPFVHEVGARPEIFSYGHRNIQGLARDPKTGNIWANEHGARGGDELNLIIAGQNYGWPEVTYSKEYWGPHISQTTDRADVPAPRVVWTPSKAPSGLAFYTSSRHAHWTGDLFSGALKFGQIRWISLTDGQVTDERKMTISARVRDVRQGPDGSLYVLTDEPDGALLRILPSGG